MKKMTLLLLLLLLMFIGVEIVLYINGQATLSNRLDRAISGAPDIHLYGKALLFQGKYDLSPTEIKPYLTSEEGIALYKLKDLADANMQPPYIYVPIPGDDQHVYRYSFPKGIGF